MSEKTINQSRVPAKAQKWRVIEQLDSRTGVSGYAIVTDGGIIARCGKFKHDAEAIRDAHNATLTSRDEKLELRELQLSACRKELDKFVAQIGSWNEEYPDEGPQEPRAETWHHERRNWIAEVERLRKSSQPSADTERLDWLETNHLQWALYLQRTRMNGIIREAIDSAMKSADKKEE